MGYHYRADVATNAIQTVAFVPGTCHGLELGEGEAATTVQTVSPHSQAAEQGVHPGSTVLRVNGDKATRTSVAIQLYQLVKNRRIFQV